MIKNLVILTGGKSSRMGTDKALLNIGEETFVEHLIKEFSPYFQEIVLSVNKPGKFSHLNISNKEIVDIYPEIGPLGGIYSALKLLEVDEIFVLSVDMPFASPKLAMEIINKSTNSDISIIKRENGKCEPLFGRYTKRCLPYMEEMVKNNHYKIVDLFDQVNTDFFYKEESQLENLVNLNTREEYTKMIH